MHCAQTNLEEPRLILWHIGKLLAPWRREARWNCKMVWQFWGQACCGTTGTVELFVTLEKSYPKREASIIWNNLPSLSGFDLSVIWSRSIFLISKFFVPSDKLPGQGISAQWDWCSCHFYCHLQHKWAAMPISLSRCWRLPPNEALGGSTRRLVPAEGPHSFQHLQPGAGVPAVRMTDLRGLCWVKQKLEMHWLAHCRLQRVVFFD